MFMVLTRFQTTKTDQRELKNMEYSSDDESERSVPEVLSRDQMTEFKNAVILVVEKILNKTQLNSGS